MRWYKMLRHALHSVLSAFATQQWKARTTFSFQWQVKLIISFEVEIKVKVQENSQNVRQEVHYKNKKMSPKMYHSCTLPSSKVKTPRSIGVDRRILIFCDVVFCTITKKFKLNFMYWFVPFWDQDVKDQDHDFLGTKFTINYERIVTFTQSLILGRKSFLFGIVIDVVDTSKAGPMALNSPTELQTPRHHSSCSLRQLPWPGYVFKFLCLLTPEI